MPPTLVDHGNAVDVSHGLTIHLTVWLWPKSPVRLRLPISRLLPRALVAKVCNHRA